MPALARFRKALQHPNRVLLLLTHRRDPKMQVCQELISEIEVEEVVVVVDFILTVDEPSYQTVEPHVTMTIQFPPSLQLEVLLLRECVNISLLLHSRGSAFRRA